MPRWWVGEQRSEREQGPSSVHAKYGQAGPPGAPNWIGKTATTCADLKKLKRSAATHTLTLPPYWGKAGTGIFPICPASPTLEPSAGLWAKARRSEDPLESPLPPSTGPAFSATPGLGHRKWGLASLRQPPRRSRESREGGGQALAGQSGGQGQTPQTLQFPCESTILLNRIMDFKMP